MSPRPPCPLTLVGSPHSSTQIPPPQPSKLSPAGAPLAFWLPLHPQSPRLLCCPQTDRVIAASRPSGYKGRRLPEGRQNPTGAEDRWLQGPDHPTVSSSPAWVSTRLHLRLCSLSDCCPLRPSLSFPVFLLFLLRSADASCGFSGANSKGTESSRLSELALPHWAELFVPGNLRRAPAGRSVDCLWVKGPSLVPSVSTVLPGVALLRPHPSAGLWARKCQKSTPGA